MRGRLHSKSSTKQTIQYPDDLKFDLPLPAVSEYLSSPLERRFATCVISVFLLDQPPQV